MIITCQVVDSKKTFTGKGGETPNKKAPVPKASHNTHLPVASIAANHASKETLRGICLGRQQLLTWDGLTVEVCKKPKKYALLNEW